MHQHLIPALIDCTSLNFQTEALPKLLPILRDGTNLDSDTDRWVSCLVILSCASSLRTHQAIAWYHEREGRVKSIRCSKLGRLLRRINNFPMVRTTDKRPLFALHRQVLARLDFRQFPHSQGVMGSRDAGQSTISEITHSCFRFF